MNAPTTAAADAEALRAQLAADLAKAETTRIPRGTGGYDLADDLTDTDEAPPTDPVELADWVVDHYTRPYFGVAGPLALDQFLARLNENLRMRRPLRAPAAGAAS